MNLSDMLSKAKRSDKSQDVPGMVEAITNDLCPLCGREMRVYKPCCGSPNGYKGCMPCGYKVNT